MRIQYASPISRRRGCAARRRGPTARVRVPRENSMTVEANFCCGRSSLNPCILFNAGAAKSAVAGGGSNAKKHRRRRLSPQSETRESSDENEDEASRRRPLRRARWAREPRAGEH